MFEIKLLSIYPSNIIEGGINSEIIYFEYFDIQSCKTYQYKVFFFEQNRNISDPQRIRTKEPNVVLAKMVFLLSRDNFIF